MNEQLEFSEILQMSRNMEMERLDRELTVCMRDEYRLDSEIGKLLENGIYEFPDVLRVRTDKRILERVQKQFSTKIHIKRTPLYFHQHDFVEILYMYRGCCRQYLENLGNCIILKEGDLFLLNQNVIHGLMQEDEDAVLIKVILPEMMLSAELLRDISHDSELFDFFMEATHSQRDYYHYLHYKDCLGEVKRFIENLMTEYYMQEKKSDEAIKCYFKLLLISLEREGRLQGSRHDKITHGSLRTGKVIQYIYDHCERVTLEELAQVFSYNSSYLSRMIRENSGITFLELVRECRLQKAAALLVCSTYSVEKIAELVGYRQAVPIYQGIKAKFNLSPGEYRKEYGKTKIDNF